ncbi:polar amino acid transport system permease protein [Labrenzia sp. EL_208]|uniref:Arginine ABC transporter permease protein ArtQ n=1 Tax=Roseibium album TaxID=311410 RepID=A0A0M6ZMD8_9HYPH|nr:ABC transporter permease [Roseibium album]MBG6146802.1 polar amino acid transport system permease protein [Labrenzia sp. EL_142]MBG6155869.1 polar amino acid transport system permease protein [Labrenzia sp. EL_162]MBG6161324.1 polar amino acid transport system permease protein [Labrenzia sp. EL_195]MBG6177132.1 polar amino acid transport system permease protein [Labrenzia sp. EL_132]MBG6194403.1 polar amino acid transport system permease protein [Labrenzia sp. EL_159]MBG6205551.1 polar ami
MEEALTLLSFGENGWGDTIAAGVMVTVLLAIATLPFGLVLGFLIALAKNSSEPSLKLAANIYTTIFRGLPELLTLFLVYFGVQIGIQQGLKLMGFDAFIEVNSFVAGMVALSLVFSSYASEAFLSAFRGIPQGQYEGGNALGLSRYQTMTLVILPQLIRLALPALGNLWLILLKETSLVSVIGLPDLVREAGIAARVTKEPFLFFGIACLVYLLLAMISSTGLSRIERWTKKGEVAR